MKDLKDKSAQGVFFHKFEAYTVNRSFAAVVSDINKLSKQCYNRTYSVATGSRWNAQGVGTSATRAIKSEIVSNNNNAEFNIRFIAATVDDIPGGRFQLNATLRALSKNETQLQVSNRQDWGIAATHVKEWAGGQYVQCEGLTW